MKPPQVQGVQPLISTVWLEYVQSYESAFEKVTKVLAESNLADAVKNARLILIKPNLTTSASAESGITTSCVFVEAVVAYLKNLNFNFEIVVGEGSGGTDTCTAFERNNYIKLRQKYNIRLCDLNAEEGVILKVPNPISIKELKVAKLALEADFIISVAKLKIHSVAKITGCLKNMMGCLPGRYWKVLVHSDASKRIVDLLQLVKPHYGIIDGVVGNELDEVVSHTLNSNILIAGYDCVAVDALAAECMGVKVEDVEHLLLAERNNLGIASLDKINIVGVPISRVRKKYRTNRPLWAFVRTTAEKYYGKLLEKIGHK